LHELGFRYAKINGNKKALVERKDLVNKRIIFADVGALVPSFITLW
jgi:hypothetical protein